MIQFALYLKLQRIRSRKDLCKLGPIFVFIHILYQVKMPYYVQSLYQIFQIGCQETQFKWKKSRLIGLFLE